MVKPKGTLNTKEVFHYVCNDEVGSEDNLRMAREGC